MTPEEITAILNAARHDGETDWEFLPPWEYYYSATIGRQARVSTLSPVSAEIIAQHYKGLEAHEPLRVIEGCRHPRERMIEWVDEGACPICLTATAGMRGEEIDRLKRGDFTPEEFQNLCHDLNDADRDHFCDGCEQYQIKLFGSSPITELKAELAALTVPAVGSWAWALEQMKAGRRVRLPEWLNNSIYIVADFLRWSISPATMKVEWFSRTDWQLAEEQGT
jgi:hypothetical protein